MLVGLIVPVPLNDRLKVRACVRRGASTVSKPPYYLTNKIELTVLEDGISKLTPTICEAKGGQIVQHTKPYHVAFAYIKSRDIVYSGSMEAARRYLQATESFAV